MTELWPLITDVAGSVRSGDPEEARQVAALKIVERLHQLDRPEAIVGWAARIAHNEAIRVYQRRVRYVLGRDLDTELHIGVGHTADHALKRELIVIPSAQAEALVLHSVLDHTWEEIGAIQGCSPKTAQSRARLAVEKLHKRLEE